jgi:hypothetical protein
MADVRQEDMPSHEEQKRLTNTADELFTIAAVVKDYPSFVPWCSGARIHREDQQEPRPGNWSLTPLSRGGLTRRSGTGCGYPMVPAANELSRLIVQG